MSTSTMLPAPMPTRGRRNRSRRVVAALISGVLAITASVVGVATPASAIGTASISGTVTSPDSDTVLEGITVTWYTFDEFGFPVGGVSTQTAPDGTYSLPDLDPGEYALEFSDATDTYVGAWLGGASTIQQSSRIFLDDGEAATGADAALRLAGSMSGTVTSALDAAPVEGVEVTALLSANGYTEQRSAVTNAAGEYLIVGMAPSDLWIVRFTPTVGNFSEEFFSGASNEFEATELSVVGGGLTSGIDATLDIGATVSGSVALAAPPGTPLADIVIKLDGTFGNSRETTTAADGTFSFVGLSTDEYRLQAIGADGLLTRWWNAAYTDGDAEIIAITTPGQAVTGIDLLLEQAGTISGVVTDSFGDPVAGVDVRADSASFGGSSFLYATTDANGAYELTGAAPVNYTVTFVPTGGVNLREQYWPGSDLRSGSVPVAGVAAAAVTGISIELPAGAIVQGTVIDAQTTDAIADILVFVGSASMQVGRYANTDADGTWIVSGLPTADDYVVEFIDFSDAYVGEYYDNARFASGAVPVTLQVGSTVSNISAALDQAATVTGRVVDALGNGLSQSQVLFAPEGSLGDGLVEAMTAPDGTYEITGLAAGEYRVLTGPVFFGDPAFRTEWFDSVFDPTASSTITITPGQQLADFDFELDALTDPEYPGAVDVDIVNADTPYPTVEFTMPTTGATPYGISSFLNTGVNGASFRASPFDELTWSLGDDLGGIDGHGRIITQAFGADGLGPAVRDVVTFGDGPAIAQTPEPQLQSADGESFTLSWGIDEEGEGVDYWTWDVFSVDKPGEPFLQSGFATDPFTVTEVIGGLEPNTQYEIYVMGFRYAGDATTFWGSGVFSTTDGPEVSGLTQIPTPTVTGGPRLGGVVTAVAATWGPAPVALQYQWLRNGAPIEGATAVTYAPTADDLGALLSVRVTGSKTGYATASRTSAPTAPVIDVADLAPTGRLSGDDRYETAVSIAQNYAPGVPVVYLATGTNYPDALSAAAAAAYQGAPLLLTTPGSVPTLVADELERLDPELVVIAGGTSVVSAAVEAQVDALLPGADVRRDSGADRYATSRVIAQRAFPASITTTAFIATGTNFPDALSASAAAGDVGAPVILVDGDGSVVDQLTRDLLDELGVENIVIAGGPSVVSVAIENALASIVGSSNVTRLSGADRYATAVAINRARFASADSVFIATGLDYADALAGAALAGRDSGPLFVVPGTCVPTPVLDEIARLGASRVVLFGGTGVLSTAVQSLLRC